MVGSVKKDILVKRTDESSSGNSDKKVGSHKYFELSLFSTAIEAISTVAENMPWVSFVKLAGAWIEARKSGEVLITTEKNTAIHLKGYSVSEAKCLLKMAVKFETSGTKSDTKI